MTELEFVISKLENLGLLGEVSVIAEVKLERDHYKQLVTKVREYLQKMPVLTAFEVNSLLKELNE